MLYDIFIGKGAPVLSGVLGILGSLCLAVPPVKTVGIRRATLLLGKLAGSKRLAGKAEGATSVVTQNLLKELELERTFNLLGAALLFLSFLFLILHAIWG